MQRKSDGFARGDCSRSRKRTSDVRVSRCDCATCTVKRLARHWQELLGSGAERAHLRRGSISLSQVQKCVCGTPCITDVMSVFNALQLHLAMLRCMSAIRSASPFVATLCNRYIAVPWADELRIARALPGRMAEHQEPARLRRPARQSRGAERAHVPRGRTTPSRLSARAGALVSLWPFEPSVHPLVVRLAEFASSSCASSMSTLCRASWRVSWPSCGRGREQQERQCWCCDAAASLPLPSASVSGGGPRRRGPARRRLRSSLSARTAGGASRRHLASRVAGSGSKPS